MLNTKITLSILTAGILALGFTSCNDNKKVEEKTLTLTTLEDKAGYAFGRNIGEQVTKQADMINTKALLLGLEDALAKKDSKLSKEEMKKTMQEFGAKAQAKAMEEMKKTAMSNKLKGETFLADNTKKDGVVTLPSGLQYKIITKGTGKTPKATDTVETNYKGTLIDGRVFDSSYERGKSVSFPVNGVIKGWTEALQLMKEGAKWELYIPSDLAYGEQGAGQLITPNSTLVFQLELLKVK